MSLSLMICDEILFCPIAAKSPVFSHVKATLDGLITIRSFPKEREYKLIKEFDRLQDVHSETYFLLTSTSSAMGLFIDLVILILITIITLTSIFLRSGINKSTQYVHSRKKCCKIYNFYD